MTTTRNHSLVTPSVFAGIRNFVTMDRQLHGLADLPCSRSEAQAIASHVNTIRSCGWTESNGDVWSLSVSAEVIRERFGSSVHITRHYMRNDVVVSVPTLTRYYNRVAASMEAAERESAYVPASVRLA